ncbi:MAG: phosphoribosylformylglycinamidine synthase subunit PurQ [Dehalococcoidia bacterium]|jgi:phosphoribosylformylglycinamidine synthase|nr:phosphoribosylformylglycinamidine synthase subunit PurQ [Dehalococcoidia bacterium]
MKIAILVFPGTWSETDCFHSFKDVLGQDPEYVWHKATSLGGYDAVVVPGGFSYGDYLRCGAIARFSPVMDAVREFADAGKPVIGICNGFQILCEAGLLPGVLTRNDHLEFRCVWTNLRTDNADTPFSHLAESGAVLRVPVSHGEGNYQADAETIDALERTNRVVFRYTTPDGEATAESNPNGSVNNIAGIINEAGNVLGMMPHPERAVEKLLGGDDGAVIFRSMVTPRGVAVH